MPLAKKSDATKTLKNGKIKLNKGFRQVETKNGRIMYFSESKTQKTVKKEVKPVLKVDNDPKELSFED